MEVVSLLLLPVSLEVRGVAQNGAAFTTGYGGATVLSQEAWRLLRLVISDLRLLCAPSLRRAIRDLRACFSQLNG